MGKADSYISLFLFFFPFCSTFDFRGRAILAGHEALNDLRLAVVLTSPQETLSKMTDETLVVDNFYFLSFSSPTSRGSLILQTSISIFILDLMKVIARSKSQASIGDVCVHDVIASIQR